MTIGSQIAQVFPTESSAIAAYSATIRTEITRVIVTNTQSLTALYSIYHDNDGAVWSRNSALFYENTAQPMTTIQPIIANQPGTGVTVDISGTFAVQTSRTSALTFTIYGVTQQAR